MNNLSTIQNLFGSEYREEPVKFDINPLVLSVRLKKMREENPSQWLRLDDSSVKAKLMGDDFNEAEVIKEYYSKKLMWTTIKDSKLSAYRIRLQQLLQHPKTILSKKEVGLFVTLPYFYEEDQVLDQIAKQYRIVNCPEVKLNLKKVQRELAYIHHTTRWVNKKKFIFYWFADDNQFVYNIQLDESNLLKKFFEHIVLTRSTSVFETNLAKVNYPFDYYKMFDFTLIKD